MRITLVVASEIQREFAVSNHTIYTRGLELKLQILKRQLIYLHTHTKDNNFLNRSIKIDQPMGHASVKKISFKNVINRHLDP